MTSASPSPAPERPPDALRLDVVIPVFDARDTLADAVRSVLRQPQADTLWLVDDGSADGSADLVRELAAQHPQRIRALALPRNGGVAAARNHALWRSRADVVAFLDADDAYADGALEAPLLALQLHPWLGTVRLGLRADSFPQDLRAHAAFAQAWRSLEMTVGGNLVCRRAVLLACGGFPEDALFRRLGGEDGALGIALTRASVVGTLFDEPVVHHRYRPGMHAERLLARQLWDRRDDRITDADHAEAEAVTARIVRQLQAVAAALGGCAPGVCRLTVQRAPVAEPSA